MSHFVINDASHVENNAINSLKNYEHFDASKGDQFSLSDMKTLRSNGEEQTVTEISPVLTDIAPEKRDRHCKESKLQICLERVRKVVRDKAIVTTMIPEPFQPWVARKHASVRQITYLCISNPGAIFFSDLTGKVWYVKQTKLASPHPLAETPNVTNPWALALFSNDRFLVAVDQSCNKVKVISNVYYVQWKSIKLHHDISNVHLPDAISTQRGPAIANVQREIFVYCCPKLTL